MPDIFYDAIRKTWLNDDDDEDEVFTLFYGDVYAVATKKT